MSGHSSNVNCSALFINFSLWTSFCDLVHPISFHLSLKIQKRGRVVRNWMVLIKIKRTHMCYNTYLYRRIYRHFNQKISRQSWPVVLLKISRLKLLKAASTSFCLTIFPGIFFYSQSPARWFHWYCVMMNWISLHLLVYVWLHFCFVEEDCWLLTSN